MNRLKVRNNLARPMGDAAEEEGHRRAAVDCLARAFMVLRKPVLERVDLIPDPRDPSRLKYSAANLAIYGILISALRIGSLRQAAAAASDSFREFATRLGMGEQTVAHPCTLTRFCKSVEDPDIFDEAVTAGVGRLIRQKKLAPFLAPHGKYMVAIDGTGTHSSTTAWSEHLLRHKHQQADGSEVTRYTAYALHADLVFPDGRTMPLASEILENAGERDLGIGSQKQDCEAKGFRRLADKLKRRMPHTRIMLLLDGLYATEAVMARCSTNNWDYMIVMKEGSCPALWTEAQALHGLDTRGEDCVTLNHKGREQKLWWVNGVDKYAEVEDASGRSRQVHRTVNIVVCEETHDVVRDDGSSQRKTSRHIWLSGERLTKGNVHVRCNLSARSRWYIEENIRREKDLGFAMEHRPSTDWRAYKCYHHLMRLGELVNAVALMLVGLADTIARLGETATIRLARETICCGLLPKTWYQRLFAKPIQLRL